MARDKHWKRKAVYLFIDYLISLFVYWSGFAEDQYRRRRPTFDGRRERSNAGRGGNVALRSGRPRISHGHKHSCTAPNSASYVYCSQRHNCVLFSGLITLLETVNYYGSMLSSGARQCHGRNDPISGSQPAAFVVGYYVIWFLCRPPKVLGDSMRLTAFVA